MMKPAPTIAVASAALVAILLVSRAVADGADNTIAIVPGAAKDAEYTCPGGTPTSSRAAELETKDWDKNALACAADEWFALSNASPKDFDTTLRALQATTAYINHVNRSWDDDLFGIHGPEWLARVARASKQGNILEARLATSGREDAATIATRALYKLAWSGNVADTKTRLGEARAAIALLERAVSLDSTAVDGNALWQLGKVYYELPEFAGGDPGKGLQILNRAYHQSPNNPALLRYAAYVDVQENDRAGARERLAKLLSIEPGSAGLQILSDQLKGGEELAARLGDSRLEKQLTEKRTRLLDQHPQILRRLRAAANMHEGVDPITGKDY
jgi:tetratricopeptide (TPR) repeat protein